MTLVRTTIFDGLDVSRETATCLQTFAGRIEKWNPAINLVSPATLPDLWERHIADSAQLFSLAPQTAMLWVDVGSGGGFPGVVIAILARELRPELRVALVEADQRKATFLKLTCAELGLTTEVVADRIENCSTLGADVMSARALAPLDRLCQYASAHLAENGIALLPKGAAYKAEVDAARARWHFELESHKSVTDVRSMILKIKDIRRV